ncbi:MAG: hypothetical protein QM528_06480 [Phycisphaerales bacterium]|nr:hypothetical protein [Phycisphaerales bacterium]
MKQKLLNLGSSLTRTEIKKVNGGKKGNLGLCHDRIDGLYNKCVNNSCYSRGSGACDPNNEFVCEADSIDYCCCDKCVRYCSNDGDCDIHS